MYVLPLSNIKCLYLTIISRVTGGNKRTVNMLRHSGMFGLDYIPVLDSVKYRTGVASYPDLPDLIKSLNGRFLEFRGERSIESLASSVASIAKTESVSVIVSGHEAPDFIQIAHKASKQSGIPWTAILQQPPFLDYEGFKIQRPLKYLRIKSVIHALEDCESFVVSQTISDELHKVSKSLKISVLNTPVGIDEDVSAAVAARNKKYDAIFFSRLSKDKGLLEIPLVWKHVTDELPDAKLVVVGFWQEEGLEEQFARLCHDKGVESHINYIGFRKGVDLYEEVKASKVSVFPSFRDTFALTVLESLACGLPVVAYDIDGLRYAYSCTSSVIRVALSNHVAMAREIISLLKDVERRETLSREGMNFSSRFTWTQADLEQAMAIKKS